MNMKLKYNFIVNEVADKMVAVAVGDDLDKFNGFIKMNDVGAEIFEILKNDVEFDEIVTLMMAKHPDSTKEEAEETISGFIAELKNNGIIDG